MTVQEIMSALQKNGSESVKKILLKHGVKEPFFGVKVAYLKTIQKKIKKDYQLAKDLFATGNADAMYLAGLIADDEKMSKKDLQAWAKIAVSNNISEYTVPWVAAGSQHGFELAQEWIRAREVWIAAAGWSTLSSLIALKPDSELDLPTIKSLLTKAEGSIHKAPNRVRYTMNGFVIAVASYIESLHAEAVKAAKKIGTVTVEMNGTACEVPSALKYIQKVKDRGSIGKKKKTVKC